MADVLVADAIQRVLSHKPLLMSAPNSASLTELYPSLANSESHLVEAIHKNGDFRVSCNNLQLNATSNLTVNSSYILYNPTLHLEITLPPNHILFDGWGLLAINTVEISFPQSLAQNLILSGSCIRDLLLFSQSDPEKRRLVLQQCGRISSTAGSQFCSIPLAGILSRGQLSNSFPIDFSCLNGFMTVNVTWNSAQRFMMVNSTGPAPAFPTAFNSIEMTWSQSAILDAGFGIRNALLSDPTATYNIPCISPNPYRYYVNIQANAGVVTIMPPLTSCPRGILRGFLMSVMPVSEISGAANGQTLFYPTSVNLASLQVDYSSTILFRADTYTELKSHMRYKLNGDDLTVPYSFYYNRVVATPAQMIGNIYYVPFDYDSAGGRSSHLLETLPSYDGANLTVSFTVDSISNRIYNSTASPFVDASLATAGAAAAEAYQIEITWILSQLIEVGQSGVDLQR